MRITLLVATVSKVEIIQDHCFLDFPTLKKWQASKTYYFKIPHPPNVKIVHNKSFQGHHFPK